MKQIANILYNYYMNNNKTNNNYDGLTATGLEPRTT